GTGNVLIRFSSSVSDDVATPPGALPPLDATVHEPPASGNTFVIQHTLPGGLTGSDLAVVWAAFGNFDVKSKDFGPCGSGSGSGSGGLIISGGSLVTAPAPRYYRLGVEEPAAEAVSTGLPPDLQRGSKRDVTLGYDELRATGVEAVWSEAAAEDVPQWRLTLRKVQGTFVAALELRGDDPASQSPMVWRSRRWDFFGRNDCVAEANGVPGVGVEPA